MLCCMAALSFTSCNTDDDGYTLTKEDIAACLNAVQGNYTGKLIYPSQNPKVPSDTTDSLDIQWSATADTTIVVNQFPVSLVAKFVEDKDLKAALETINNKELKSSIYFTNVSPVVFLANATPLVIPVRYGEADHQVQISFYVNNTYSYGVYNSSNKKSEIQLLLGGIFVDKGQTNYLKTPTPILFSGSKQ